MKQYTPENGLKHHAIHVEGTTFKMLGPRTLCGDIHTHGFPRTGSRKIERGEKARPHQSWQSYVTTENISEVTVSRAYDGEALLLHARGRTITYVRKHLSWLWPPYVIGQAGHCIFALWFLSSIFYLSSFFFYSSPNLSGRRLDVYHTLRHGVALVRI